MSCSRRFRANLPAWLNLPVIVVGLLATTVTACTWVVMPESPLATPESVETTLAQPAKRAPEASLISHRLEEQEDCLTCHAANDESSPVPEGHEGWKNGLCLSCHRPVSQNGPVPTLPTLVTIDFCLGCHGPYEDVMAATVDYVAPDDVAGNPHTYLPHDTDRIVECKFCHQPHPIPLESSVDVPKADVETCYTECHHTADFRQCAVCH